MTAPYHDQCKKMQEEAQAHDSAPNAKFKLAEENLVRMKTASDDKIQEIGRGHANQNALYEKKPYLSMR